MKLLKTKKVGQLDTFVKGIVGVAIVLGVGLLVLVEFQDTMTADSTEANATGDIIDTLADIPTWIGIIVVVAMAALVMAYFYFKNK